MRALNFTEVTKRLEFSCAYIYKKGNTFKLEAHNYKLEATVSKSDINDPKYIESHKVLDFEDLTKAMKSSVPDASFVYELDDPHQVSLAKSFESDFLIPTFDMPCPISAESLLNTISLMLEEELKPYPGVVLVETKLRENASSFVSWKPINKE